MDGGEDHNDAPQTEAKTHGGQSKNLEPDTKVDSSVSSWESKFEKNVETIVRTIAYVLWMILGFPIEVLGIVIALIYILFMILVGVVFHIFTGREFMWSRKIVKNLLSIYWVGFIMIRNAFKYQDRDANADELLDNRKRSVFSSVVQAIGVTLILTVSYLFYKKIDIRTFDAYLFYYIAIICGIVLAWAIWVDIQSRQSASAAKPTESEISHES